jgi:GTP-binding protein
MKLGKTTLVDKLLEHCGNELTFERAMDSNEHEKERGITIMSKYTRLYYKDYTLHVVDTPGHADFGGEVERILSMVDGVVLLVDATEGPMAQTKFVLSKAIAAKKKAVVVLNKIDRDTHRAEEVENEIFDLFCALTADDDLLQYPSLYASGRQGWVCHTLDEIPGKNGVVPLLDTIVSHIPPPRTQNLTLPFSLNVNTISTDAHLGRLVTGRVETGRISIGDRIKVLTADGRTPFPESKVTKLFYLRGLTRVDVDSANAGELISIAGCTGGVTDTICDPLVTEPVPSIPISPPIISMTFGPNDSPLAGREGSKLTSTMIKDRLYREVENNVTIFVKPSPTDSDSLDVQGRGELQLGILVETMRREGYELTVSPPKVLAQIGEDGIEREPIEEVIVDIDHELQGIVIEQLSVRKGDLIEIKDIGNRARLIFNVPSRGMIGFRHQIITATRGNATVNSLFSHYDLVNKKDFLSLSKGKIISVENGKTTGYALDMVQERGLLYVNPGEEVYEGMVIGEYSKIGDCDVNPCRAKKLSNVRSVQAEEKVNLAPPKRMTVEEVMAAVDEDEVIEITPKNVRLRKRILDTNARQRWAKTNKKL